MIIRRGKVRTYSPIKKSIVEIFDSYTGSTICYIRIIPYYFLILLYMKFKYQATIKDCWDYTIIPNSHY